MNGVITDDEDIHELSTKEVFYNIGVHLTTEIYQELCLGRTDIAAFKDIIEKFEIENQHIEALIAAKSLKYQRLIKGNLKVYPGVIQLIKDLYKKYTLALTSSSTFEEVHTVVKQLDIKDLFNVIVSSKDVIHGKPQPEPYLLTAVRLSVKCDNCLVIEDSENGVRSAKSAGMKCIAITNTEDRIKLTLADKIISSYSTITDDLVQNI